MYGIQIYTIEKQEKVPVWSECTLLFEINCNSNFSIREGIFFEKCDVTSINIPFYVRLDVLHKYKMYVNNLSNELWFPTIGLNILFQELEDTYTDNGP